jgi:hypothetical protein
MDQLDPLLMYILFPLSLGRTEVRDFTNPLRFEALLLPVAARKKSPEQLEKPVMWARHICGTEFGSLSVGQLVTDRRTMS